MNIIEEYDPFRAKVRDAWRAPGLTSAELQTLIALRRAWCGGGIGLTAVEEEWLTQLARRGGWTAARKASLFRYVEETA